MRQVENRYGMHGRLAWYYELARTFSRLVTCRDQWDGFAIGFKPCMYREPVSVNVEVYYSREVANSAVY